MLISANYSMCYRSKVWFVCIILYTYFAIEYFFLRILYNIKERTTKKTTWYYMSYMRKFNIVFIYINLRDVQERMLQTM